MDLVLIDAQLVREISLLGKGVLDLAHRILVYQAIVVAQSDAHRLGDGLDVIRYGQQAGVARACGVDLSVRQEKSIAAAPAEPNGADLARARDLTNVLDELLDDGLRHGLAVLEQPRVQRRAHDGRALGLVDDGLLLADAERWLDALQEVDGQGVALLDVGDVAVEALLGVVVGQEAHVLELPAEDCERFGLALSAGWNMENSGGGRI